MDILKRFARGLSSQIFKFSIFFAAVGAATVVAFGSQAGLKDTLNSSGAYDRAVDGIIEQATKEQRENGEGVPIDDADVQKVIRDTLSPEFLEQNSSSAIDGIFGWLQGNTERPEFTIDLTETKQKLANGLGEVAFARASNLQPCTVQQLQTLDPNNTDIFSLPCLPPGVDLQTERAKLVDQIANGDEFLKDSTISADELPKENGQDVFDKAENVPTVYQWLVRLPWILGGLAVLAATALLFLHDERRRGIWVIGRTLLITGVILVIFTLVSNYIISTINPVGTDIAQKIVTDVVRSFAREINSVIIKFGVAYAVVGAAIMLGIHFTKPKTLEQTPDKENTPVSTTETTEPPIETNK